MFKEIIDIKTYLTNIQTPHIWVGGVYCVSISSWEVWEDKKTKPKQLKWKERKCSTNTHIQRLPPQWQNIYLQVKAEWLHLIYIISWKNKKNCCKRAAFSVSKRFPDSGFTYSHRTNSSSPTKRVMIDAKQNIYIPMRWKNRQGTKLFF